MKINELANKIDRFECNELINVYDLVINYQNIYDHNKEQWYKKIDPCEEFFESDDEIIVDYFSSYFQQHEIDVNAYIKICLFLIGTLGSSYAATNLSPYGRCINESNANMVLNSVIQKYLDSEEFVQDILKNFIIDTFQCGELWGQEISLYSNNLSEDNNNFISNLLKSDHKTINKDDARLFVDGSPRI